MDTGLSDHSGFKYLWADHPNSTVPPLLVVVQFDVFKHLVPHHIPCFKWLSVDRFHLETVEEAFCTGVDAPISVKSRIELIWGHIAEDDTPHE